MPNKRERHVPLSFIYQRVDSNPSACNMPVACCRRGLDRGEPLFCSPMGAKCKSSPVARTISSVHNGFDRCEHSIFFFQQLALIETEFVHTNSLLGGEYSVRHFCMRLKLQGAYDKIKIYFPARFIRRRMRYEYGLLCLFKTPGCIFCPIL